MVEEQRGPSPEPQKSCADCGGPLRTSSGPGRSFPISRGRICLPDDFVYDECPACGKSSMGDALVLWLGEIVKASKGRKS